MSRTRLILNGQAIPLPPDTDIAITYQAHDIRNMGSRDGAFAESFTLPETNAVRKALGHSEMVTSATDTPYKLLPAVIESDYNPLLTGVASHTEVNEGYAIDVDGQNTDWFAAMEGKNLRDLDLSDLDHNYTQAVVAAANTHDPARGYTYPLVNYGYWNRRFYDPTNQHFSELFPAVYVSELLKRIAAPYTLTGSLLTDARFMRMVVPFTNGRLQYRESYRAQYDLTATNTYQKNYDSPQSITFESATPAAMWSLDSRYNVAVRGWYKAKATLKLSMQAPAGVTNELRISLRDGSGTVTELTEVFISPGGNQQITLETSTHLLSPGDQLYVFMDRGYPGARNSNTTQVQLGSTFEVELINAVATSGEVHLDANLPDMPQEDLVLTICNLFNVLIQTDPVRKVIRLDLLNDIKRKPAVDWSSKIDWTNKPRFTFAFEDYGQRNYIGYEPLDYEDEAGVAKQSRMEITVANERLEPESELYTSPFTGTEILPAFRESQLLPYIPMVEVKAGSYGLWRNSITYGVDDYVLWAGNTWKATTEPNNLNKSPGLNSSYWQLVPVEDVLDFKGAAPRLLLVEPRGNSMPVGDNYTGAFTQLSMQGVFEKANGTGINAEAMKAVYHSVTEMMLQQTRIMTLDMRLKLPDISQLDFLKPVVLFVPERNLEGMFYLNKVNQFNPNNSNSTEVELVRIYGLPMKLSTVTQPVTAHLEYSEEYSEEYN